MKKFEFKTKEAFYNFVELTDTYVEMYRNETDEKRKEYLKEFIQECLEKINNSKYRECNYKYKDINC